MIDAFCRDQDAPFSQVLRENRLGTLMVRGQHVSEGGSVSLVYAPKVTDAEYSGPVSDG